MKTILLVLIASLALSSGLRAENLDVAGDMSSEITYSLHQTIDTTQAVKVINLSYVLPQEFNSPTYRQSISNFRVDFVPKPQDRKTTTDRRGNRILTATWTNIPGSIDIRLSFRAQSQTSLTYLETASPFPPARPPQEYGDFLAASPLVQSDHPRIRQLAANLTREVTTQFDAVQRVISFVVDHLQYVSPPPAYDALFSLETGKGNCQNFSHLAAALLRATNVPTRIVNGITINRPFDIAWQEGTYTFKMGQGRHSWIEVWFADLGWVPFDPQSSQLFVSNRYIRVEVGTDNEETKNDGLMRWSQASGTTSRPRLMENIAADFPSDRVNLRGTKQSYGPKNLLLTPVVKAPFKKIALPPPPVPPPPVAPEELIFDVPFVFGNLLFPEGVDFAFPFKITERGDNNFEFNKNFMVETAEYVTTRLTQYAQVVVLDRPLALSQVGLALHRFGGEGWLWVDIYADQNGKPGAPLATSELLDVGSMSPKPGYRWVDFAFAKPAPMLAPGSYWIALGFTGSPIVNWFFTYGKPVGPVHGTRYKGVFDQDWSGALNYEFNYRVAGMTAARTISR